MDVRGGPRLTIAMSFPVEVADLAKELETKAGTWIVTTGVYGSISGGNSNISYPTWGHLPNINKYSLIFIVYIYIIHSGIPTRWCFQVFLEFSP